MFTPHPSATLNRLFEERPYQGALPESAHLVFLGLDANYAVGIEAEPVFSRVVEYHADGVAFWRRHGVHHPFLLPSYSGDGKRYHRNFSRIGLTPDYAAEVSFVELLHVPTVGRNHLHPSDLDANHLARLQALCTDGKPRAIFTSAGVLALLADCRGFEWLKRPETCDQGLPLISAVGKTRMYRHLHFSNYGKFQLQMEREAAAISAAARTLLLPDAEACGRSGAH